MSETKRRLDWRAKAFAFRLLDVLPFGHVLYRQLQKRITHTIPRELAPTRETAYWSTEAVRSIGRHGHDVRSGGRFFEFGAGVDLYDNLVLWCYGVNHQIAVDLRRLATPDQVNNVIRHLQADPPPDALRLPSRMLRESRRFTDDLLEFYGIEYQAPADAANMALESGSIDVVVTTSVLEHVPFAELRAILSECHRLMHPGSLMSHVIDYSDHFSHTDPSINAYNFLRFSESEWARFNTGLHHQNRGRHVEYRSLFLEAGFTIMEERTVVTLNAAELLASVPVAGRFRAMPPTELVPTVGHFILGKGPE